MHGIQERQGRLSGAISAPSTASVFQIGLAYRVFFVILTLALWTKCHGSCRDNGGVDAWSGSLTQGWGVKPPSGVLIGARLADSRKSHIELSPEKGYKPNPGKASVSLYITEAAVLVVVFAPGLIRNWQFAGSGHRRRHSLFWLLVPTSLRLLAMVFPPSRNCYG